MRIGVISQARLGSKRLPGKVLLEVAGKSFLKYHSDRIRESGLEFFIATTDKIEDDKIVKFCQTEGIQVFRGDEKNVLSRYYHCAKKFNLEAIVRVTSDCPLIDGHLIKAGIVEYKRLNEPKLYLSNVLVRTFPIGFDFEIFSFELLKEAYMNATLTSDLEHVTPYIHQNKSGIVVLKNIYRSPSKGDYRVTLDTDLDFYFFKKLIEEYNGVDLNVDQIISVLDNHPDLVNINKSIIQKNYLSSEYNDIN